MTTPPRARATHLRVSAHTRLLEDVRDERTRELLVLNAIAEALNSAPEVQAALERTLRLVGSLLGLRTGWIWLIDPDTGHFYHAVSWNLPPYLEEPVRMRGVACWCIEAFRDRELAPKNIDVIECSRLRPAVRRNATDLTRGLRYHASVPLYFQDKPLGIMNVTGPAWRKLSAEELGLLSTIAYQVGIAVERARLAEDSAQLARAEERARVAREIHDTLAQGLTAIALDVEGAMHLLEHSPQRARARLQRALQTARHSLEDARRSVLDLRAAPLAGKPLPEALASLARQFASETGIRVQVRVDPRLRLPLRAESELFRIAQEAVQNVRAHAEARKVEIRMTAGPRRVSLTIRDDGRGFDPTGIPQGRQGLVGMRERAALLGGALRVATHPGRGTRITVSIPRSEQTA